MASKSWLAVPVVTNLARGCATCHLSIWCVRLCVWGAGLGGVGLGESSQHLAQCQHNLRDLLCTGASCCLLCLGQLALAKHAVFVLRSM